MTDINLLPQNKRYREKQEKTDSKAMNFSVSLTEAEKLKAEKNKKKSPTFWESQPKNIIKSVTASPVALKAPAKVKKPSLFSLFGREKHKMALPKNQPKSDYLVPKITVSQKTERLLADQTVNKLKDEAKIKSVFRNEAKVNQLEKIKPVASVPVKKTILENSKPISKEGIMPKVNLIPEELIFDKRLGLITQLSILVLVVALSGGVVFGAYYLISSSQSDVNQKMVERTGKISELQKVVEANKQIENNNIYLQQKVLAIKGNLDSRILWSKFFDLLAQHTLKTVYYTGFTADTSGFITLPAVATSYGEAARQIAALRQSTDFVSQVMADNATLSSLDNGGGMAVNFIIKIKLADNVFKK
jgi:hypothetical protein